MTIFFATLTVSQASDLQDVHVAQYANGTMAYAIAEDAFYYLKKTSGATADGVLVIAPRSGSPIAGGSSARWLRQSSSGGSGAGLRATARVDASGGGYVVQSGFVGTPNHVSTGDWILTLASGFDLGRCTILVGLNEPNVTPPNIATPSAVPISATEVEVFENDASVGRFIDLDFSITVEMIV